MLLARFNMKLPTYHDSYMCFPLSGLCMLHLQEAVEDMYHVHVASFIFHINDMKLFNKLCMICC